MLALGRRPDACTYTRFRAPTRGPHHPNITNIEKEGDGCPAGAGRKRKHRDEVAESKEGDATFGLFLKHPDTIDATLTTYV